MTQIREQMKNLTLLIPASITIISIFLSLITTFFSYKIINRVENKQHYFIPFKLFNLPMSVFWFYFLVIILSFFNTYTSTTMVIVVGKSMVILKTLMILIGSSFVFHFA